LGLPAFVIGLVIAAAIAGSAAMTVVWSLAADRYGRRRTVMTMALLMGAGGILFALSHDPWLLVLAAFTGTISATSSEVGVFNTVDQAILPQAVAPEHRTWAFALYGLVASAGGFVVLALVAYWFTLRWGLAPEVLAVVFFWVGIVSALSFLAAGWLAGRIGLLRTMVFTHLPSNVLLMLVPLMPTAG